MNKKNFNVLIPKEFLDEMEVYSTIISPIHQEMGILIMSQNLNRMSNDIVIRLYRLQKEKNKKSYEIIYELQAFSFSLYNQAKSFLDYLPNMSAIEMLLMLNPEPQYQ
ncbi:hypothetical protein [Bacillus litorisediminis]|uniref:hypothetical protein n=1 Tax=Bacillus litorisediminis TaxID=2922713 RepID=UPI001FAD10EC|nr:hypothetical protein [Bacillus litorisediminis]